MTINVTLYWLEVLDRTDREKKRRKRARRRRRLAALIDAPFEVAIQLFWLVGAFMLVMHYSGIERFDADMQTWA